MIQCPTCHGVQRAPDHGGLWKEDYTYVCPRCMGAFTVMGPLASLPPVEEVDVDKWVKVLEWRMTQERV